MADLILKEGRRYVVAAFAAALVLALLHLDCLAFAALLFGLATAWTYRRPVRGSVHLEKGSVVAPCDGKVTAIETRPDGVLCVEIESGCLDASLLTMPFDGTILAQRVLHGARLGRKSPLADTLNEQAYIKMEAGNGRRLEMVHMATLTPAPLVIDAAELPMKRTCGSRYGIHTHGVTRIYLPATARVAVNSGERVTGGESLLGYLG